MRAGGRRDGGQARRCLPEPDVQVHDVLGRFIVVRALVWHEPTLEARRSAIDSCVRAVLADLRAADVTLDGPALADLFADDSSHDDDPIDDTRSDPPPNWVKPSTSIDAIVLVERTTVHERTAMPRLLLILLVVLGGAAIWRRKEIRNDADRASKALAGAAESAKSRVRPGDAAGGDQSENEAPTAAFDAADASDAEAHTESAASAG